VASDDAYDTDGGDASAGAGASAREEVRRWARLREVAAADVRPPTPTKRRNESHALVDGD